MRVSADGVITPIIRHPRALLLHLLSVKGGGGSHLSSLRLQAFLFLFFSFILLSCSYEAHSNNSYSYSYSYSYNYEGVVVADWRGWVGPRPVTSFEFRENLRNHIHTHTHKYH